jgi:hypothetical protein
VATRAGTSGRPERQGSISGGPGAEAFFGHFDRAAYHFFLKYNIKYGGGAPRMGLHDFLTRFERAVMFEALLRAHGSQKRTAEFLKLKKQTLNMKLKKQKIRIAKIPI